ncbi:MAG: extracellular matrix/biofilm biosynthesis regulator RemA family protein [Desulfobacterales bacterium]
MKSKNLLRVGFGKKVSAERIIAIVNPDSAPMKRLKTDARQQNNLIDLTSNHSTRSMIIMDDNRVFYLPSRQKHYQTGSINVNQRG